MDRLVGPFDPYAFLNALFTSLSLCANVALLTLVLRRTPRQLRRYKKSLACSCIASIVYALSTYVVDLRVCLLDGTVLYSVRHFLGMPLHGRFFMLSFYLFVTYTSTFVATVPFIYRYCDICKRWAMGRFVFIFIVLVEIAFAMFVALNQHVVRWPVVHHIAQNMSQAVTYTAYVPFLRLDDLTTSGLGSTVPLCLMFLAAHYAVIRFCYNKVIQTLNHEVAKGKLKKISGIDVQLNRMIGYQAYAALVFAVLSLLPLTLAVLNRAVLLVHMMEVSQVVQSLILAVSAGMAVLIFSPYKYAALNAFSLQKSKQTPVQVISSIVTASTAAVIVESGSLSK